MERILGLSDIDGTLLSDILLFPVATLLREQKVISSENNERIHVVRERFNAGDIDYSTFAHLALLRFCEAMAEKKVSMVEGAIEETLEDIEFYPWVEPTFNKISERGRLVIVSAEPSSITHAVAKKFEADHFSSTVGLYADGTYTGELIEVLGSAEKKRITRAQKELTPTERVVIFGDTIGDAGMLSLASSPEDAFCINPDHHLRKIAADHGMTVVDQPSVSDILI